MTGETPETLEMFLRACTRTLKNSETPSLDARMIAQFVLGLDAAGLILAAQNPLNAQDKERISELIERRSRGEPAAYLVGHKEFRSLSFKTFPGVLVPRPDSETLIDAVEDARPQNAPLQILDLGVGTGCLLLALLKHFPNAFGLGVDRNINAARLAKENAQRLGFEHRATFFCGDWFTAMTKRFDVIISNPPYIRTSDRDTLACDIVNYEDEGALFAGPEGLDAYADVLDAAAHHLAQDGLIVLELGAGQEQPVRELAASHLPEATIYMRSDLVGIPRALIADRQVNRL